MPKSCIINIIRIFQSVLTILLDAVSAFYCEFCETHYQSSTMVMSLVCIIRSHKTYIAYCMGSSYIDNVLLIQDSAWEKAEEGWGGNNGDGTFSPPKDFTDVKILNGNLH